MACNELWSTLIVDLEPVCWSNPASCSYWSLSFVSLQEIYYGLSYFMSLCEFNIDL